MNLVVCCCVCSFSWLIENRQQQKMVSFSDFVGIFCLVIKSAQAFYHSLEAERENERRLKDILKGARINDRITQWKQCKIKLSFFRREEIRLKII